MEYTVFYEHNGGYSSALFDAGCMEEALEHFESSYGHRRPVAWATERTLSHGGIRKTGVIRKESLLAGRLIEKTASGWVALGAEKQEDELRKGEPTSADLTDDEVEALFHNLNFQKRVVRTPITVKRVARDPNAAMILRDGPAKPKTYAPFTPMVTFIDEPVSTAKPNPFPTTLRSPDCDSGPSDHLNASRHQMAGMSKS